MSSPLPASPIPASVPGSVRLRVAGKFFRAGDQKIFLRGVCYGPFQPNTAGEPFPEMERLAADLAHVRDLGFDTVRLYELPSPSLLEEAEKLGLRLLVTIPWTDHVDFMRSPQLRQQIEQRVVDTVRRLKDHSCIAAFLVGNEIEKTLVRWMGPVRVQRFLEQIISAARQEAPDHLFSYATYPSTEYLIPRNADFLAVNVFLERPDALAAYLQRLQNLAGNKPLIITEFGLDVAAHGETTQAETFQWQQDCMEHAGVAGNVWFSYTDEWFRGGQAVTQWQFGLVDAKRSPRPVCEVAKQCHAIHSSLTKRVILQRISVVVCTHNGTATLAACLDSLSHINYPDYEVLVIDDGSTADIESIAKAFPDVRYYRQEHAGLSVARNLGANLATGSIIAYTDDDCLVDEDWLTYLAKGFEDPQWVAAGGPNIPPPPRNRIEAVVAAAPGAPAHVLLNDIEAEHLPGCNFAVRKEALLAIGGFRAPFVTAGDDVDICWRLREAGGKLRYVPTAMVWHHRRFTLGAYLRQQRGYGRAEALLMKEHPERFGPLGGARWRGAIYGDWQPACNPVEGAIFHGPFGNGLFQGIYANPSYCLLDWMSGVLWLVLAITALLLRQPWIAVGLVALSGALAVCRMRLLPAFPFVLQWQEKLLLLALCWWQPVAREWARIMGMICLRAKPSCRPALREVFVPSRPRKLALPLGELTFWSEDGIGRDELLQYLPKAITQQGWSVRQDDGWRLFDLESKPRSDSSAAVITTTEYHNQKRRLTRVRLLWRLNPMIISQALLVLLLCLSWSRSLTTGVLVGVLLTTGFALCATYIRRRMKEAVQSAAAAAGLTPCPCSANHDHHLQ